MTLFWILTAVLVVIAIAIFVIPMYIGKEYDDAASRDELNKAFFKDRIHELEEESQEGLVDSQQDMVTDLQQTLLDDLPVTEKQQATYVSPAMVVPGLILIVGICYGVYGAVGSSAKVEAWHQAVNRLPELTQRLMGDNAANEPLSDQDMSDLTLALRTKLHKDGDDPMGWLLLGRIAIANRDAATAEMAMKRAYDLNPVDTAIRLGYAQTLMLSGKPGQSELARQILRQVIKTDHTNVQALSLLAFDAFEQKHYQQAVDYWTMMKTLIGPNDSRTPMLTRSIERAKMRINGADGSAVAPDPTAIDETTTSTETQNIDTDKQVTATIALGKNVVLPKQGNIIISVHDADGSPMPIAAVKLPLSTTFPLTVTLTDKDSMIPQRQLSSLSKMIIKARVDSDGNVMTKQGDWYGQSSQISLGGETAFVINKQY